MHRSVLYLCAIVLFYVESFPLDEDVCDNNNYFNNLQAYNSDEMEICADACPAPRDFNRREIPLRFRKPVSEDENDLGINEKSLEGYQEDMYLRTKQKYNKQIEENESSNESNNPIDLEDSYQILSKSCHRPKSHHQFNSFHENSKSKRPKYDSYFMKYAGAKSYRVPPFETFYKSYSQYGAPGMKELNTENLEEIVEVNKKPHSMEIDIKEEMIDKPTDVEEVNVERVIKESNDENSEDKNEENVKDDEDDNRENSDNDEEQDETEEEEDSETNTEHITLKEQKSTTENAELKERHTTIHV